MSQSLRAWLRRSPQPTAVLADDRRVEVVRSNPRCWTELAETLETISPSKISCIDGAGKVLRAKAFESSDGETPSQTAEPESELATFAKLLAQAYNNGATAQATAYASIFEENTKLVRLLADRLGALEQAWQRSLNTHARLVTELAEAQSQDNGDDSILGAIAAGIAQGKVATLPREAKK